MVDRFEWTDHRSGEPIPVTKEQEAALLCLARRYHLDACSLPVEYSHLMNCLLVPLTSTGMVFGIEPDGYTHT